MIDERELKTVDRNRLAGEYAEQTWKVRSLEKTTPSF